MKYAEAVTRIVKTLLRKPRPVSLDSVKAEEQINAKLEAYLKILKKHQPTVWMLNEAAIRLQASFMVNIMHHLVNAKQVTGAVPSPAVRKRKKAE